MARMAPMDSYRAQAFAGDKRVMNISGLSVDAARHLAQVHAALGETGRIIAESHDYTEVYCSDGSVRRGEFAQTTLVKGGR